jgi:hypothetical protein
VSSVKIAHDRADQCRGLHGRQKVTEEALLCALEGRSCGGSCLRVQGATCAGDVGGPHGRVEVVVNYPERAGVSIVDANLLRRELVFDELVLDALVGQRARCIEAERLEVARQHLHRRNTALLDRLDKLGPGREWEVITAP